MEVNTLVIWKKHESLGICCVSGFTKTKVKINVGREEVFKVKENELSEVDVSKCKTLKFSDWQRMSMCNSSNIPSRVIAGNELKEYVGIGWVTIRIITILDLELYPRLTD